LGRFECIVNLKRERAKQIGLTIPPNGVEGRSSHTGIRLWIGRGSALGSVVMMVKVLSTSPAPRCAMSPKAPANANSSLVLR